MQYSDGVAMWDAVFRMSELIINDDSKRKMQVLRSEIVKAQDGMSGPSWNTIRDLRTVHMGGGRQCFKTTWIASLIKREPDSILVVIDRQLKDAFIENHITPAERNEYVRRIFTVRDIMALIHNGETWILEKLRNCSKLVFDDASYNYMIKNDKFVSGISGQLNESVTVVMVG